MDIHILLFYKFVELDDLENFKKAHLAACEKIGLKGKILVAEEGINGSVSGTVEQTEAYKELLTSDPRFSDIAFKEEIGTFHPFRRMVVKIKPEIIRIDQKVDMSKVGKYLEPQEFLELYEKNEDMLILDTRNDYEYEVGHFKNAVKSDISTFREFPAFVEKLKDYKDKKVVMYCTGGIRCEKASAYMLSQGFKDVSQLHGGVITYVQNLPNTTWEGSCFVFDDRLTTNMGQTDQLNECIHCGTNTDLMRNCKNQECNKKVFFCPGCREEMHSCCSDACKKIVLSC